MVLAASGAIYLLALACPVSMGLMMVFMGKGMGKGSKHKDSPPNGHADDQHTLADLKAEQARLAEKLSALEGEHKPAAEPAEEAERTTV